MTLLPGDIISTGTPAGNGPLTAADVVTVRVSGVGDLVNLCTRANKERAMKIFVDSGSIKDIEALENLGVIDGVTTNPSLMSKE